MKLFEGKSPNERNKIIAAAVLGVMCLVVLYFAFVRSLIFSSSPSTTATVKASPTPSRGSQVPMNPRDLRLPSLEEQEMGYSTVPIDYRPGSFYSPDPGRNIFAFYEPAPPCPTCPTPTPPPTPLPPPPSPAPTPPVQLAFVSPGSTFAGSKGFRLEIQGDHFTPELKVFFNQNELPTSFVSGQKLVTDIPAEFIAGPGLRQVIVRTPNGALYSNPVMFDVQPPPKPSVQYVGMITRKRSNNDTAYFMEQGQQTPRGARLNDVVQGRFRLISIAENETVLEDVTLGFKHRLPLYKPAPGTVVSGPAPAGGRPAGFENYVPYNPGTPGAANPAVVNPNANVNTVVPGIPDNIPRYTPPPPRRPPSNTKGDVDDDEDGDNP